MCGGQGMRVGIHSLLPLCVLGIEPCYRPAQLCPLSRLTSFGNRSPWHLSTLEASSVRFTLCGFPDGHQVVVFSEEPRFLLWLRGSSCWESHRFMAHFLQVRVAFEKFLAASCDTPEPLCKLFLFRAARGFVDLCSDVLGWVTGTSQSLVSFCPHPPGRRCLAE